MLYWGDTVDGWFFTTNELKMYQKVNGKAVCYINRMLFHFRLTFYVKGHVNGLCTLEARSIKNPMKLFDIAEEWLVRFEDGDLSKLEKCEYHIANPDGVWGEKFEKDKLMYVHEVSR